MHVRGSYAGWLQCFIGHEGARGGGGVHSTQASFKATLNADSENAPDRRGGVKSKNQAENT